MTKALPHGDRLEDRLWAAVFTIYTKPWRAAWKQKGFPEWSKEPSWESVTSSKLVSAQSFISISMS